VKSMTCSDQFRVIAFAQDLPRVPARYRSLLVRASRQALPHGLSARD
jgi:hypothetical protein